MILSNPQLETILDAICFYLDTSGSELKPSSKVTWQALEQDLKIATSQSRIGIGYVSCNVSKAIIGNHIIPALDNLLQSNQDAEQLVKEFIKNNHNYDQEISIELIEQEQKDIKELINQFKIEVEGRKEMALTESSLKKLLKDSGFVIDDLARTYYLPNIPGHTSPINALFQNKELPHSLFVLVQDYCLTNIKLGGTFAFSWPTFLQSAKDRQLLKDNIMSNQNTFGGMLKKDLTDAAYRVAASQLSTAMRNAILTLLKKQGVEEGKLKSITNLLESEYGNAIVAAATGYALTYTPKLKEDPRVLRLAQEFRINGVAVAGNAAFNTLAEHFVPVITKALSALPKEADTNLRVNAAEKNTNYQPSQLTDKIEELLEHTEKVEEQKQKAAIS